jgi:predicted protein tyrosine phosphatase
MDSLMNRLANAKNQFQGKYKRVLCVCSAGLLRSPTAAYVLSQEPYNFNTRAAGVVTDFALVPVDRVLLEWADEVVCMDDNQALSIRNMLEEPKRVIVLNIPDTYRYREPELIEAIRKTYDAAIAN